MLMSLGLTIQAHRMSSSEQDAKGAAAEAALIQLGFATHSNMGAQMPVRTVFSEVLSSTESLR